MEFTRDFEALSQVFHSDMLRLVGGEPLLHPEILSFLREARRIGITDYLVIFTNGVLLHQVPSEFWELIDGLEISVYPGVKRKLSDDDCVRICKAHNIRLRFNDMPEFTRTLITKRIEDPELVGAIFRECKNANDYSCNTVHDGRLYRCSIAPLMKQWLALHGIDFDNHGIDGVALHNNPHLYEELDDCLNGYTPLAACTYCLGTSGPSVPHRQLNRRGRSMSLQEDNSRDVEAVRARLLATAK
jgi:MoaA/NifB/PqqE/SkfB family radical SAM enzyme